MPLDGFYEWQKTGAGKQPYAIGLKGGGLMGIRLVGDMALARRRARAQLHDRHHRAERIVRGASQPHARGAEARGLAAMAWRAAGDGAGAKARCWPPTLPTT